MRLNIYLLFAAAITLATACDNSPTSPIAEPFTSRANAQCNEVYDENCELRSLSLSEAQQLTNWANEWNDGPCSYLGNYFSIGWGERTKVWEERVDRFEEPLQGDYHGTEHALYPDEVHVYTEAENLEKTWMHEIIHRTYPDLEESEVDDETERCYGGGLEH